jgi:hypothetical protein
MSKWAKRLGWPALLIAVLGVAVHIGEWNVLAKAAIPAAVALVFGSARRYLPARALADRVSSYSMPALNEQFRSTQWMVGFAMVIVGIAFFWLTHLALVETNRALGL